MKAQTENSANARLEQDFPADMLARLQHTITAGEAQHTGQLLLCIEASLPSSYVERHVTPSERARSLFGKYGVWDTEDNNGALLYLLVDKHAVELVADRALNRLVPQAQWSAIVQELCVALRNHAYESGLQTALQRISQLQAQHFPARAEQLRENKVPDAPVLLGK